MTATTRRRPSAPDDPVFTTRDAAHHLGVSVSTAQLWMEQGTLASWKTPGGHRRCRLSEVERLQGIGAGKAARRPEGGLDAEYLSPAAPAYPVPQTEQRRLAALAHSGLVDSPPDHAFDRITWLAAQITGCPMALVSLLTTKRQWFKSRIGIAAAETPREHAFCSHAILGSDGLVVTDAREDSRFSANPLVLGEPHIRFYAGLPVSDPEGNRLGTLCVLDSRPRSLTVDQLRALRELTDIVTAEIARAK
ncbi:helix-turn-helix domain-containing protein [Massilia glaciei]|uniref:Helix-turn-helix domain-containing protein n=2 Tax=Massilia glaciei TaxID=1524097 RepID=A0A2U2HGI9_9BURK|nr:helix-turn-helix domain-containing protein [Massilia glaciei]